MKSSPASLTVVLDQMDKACDRLAVVNGLYICLASSPSDRRVFRLGLSTELGSGTPLQDHKLAHKVWKRI